MSNAILEEDRTLNDTGKFARHVELPSDDDPSVTDENGLPSANDISKTSF